jgi:hypothetical protein
MRPKKENKTIYQNPSIEVIGLLPVCDLCLSPGGDSSSSGQAGGFIYDNDVEEGGSF